MVNYNNFAKTFSSSRKNMKWEELEYFLSFLEGKVDLSILDIGCGNGRLLSHIKDQKTPFNEYLGVDLSEGLLEEASELHPEARFLHLNMNDIEKIQDTFNTIFFIASFHHLDKIEDRLQVLKNARNILKPGGIIFFTNWSLNSELNKKRYEKAIIEGSENEFGSLDYNIKIGEFDRYYHCFNLKELEYLFKEAGFEIIENREFDNKRNFISIIKKTGE